MSAGGLRTALDLYEVGEKMVYQRLRRELGDETAARVALAAWRQQRPGAEQGDGPGTPSARSSHRPGTTRRDLRMPAISGRSRRWPTLRTSVWRRMRSR